jgi:hypothetical protein
MNSISTKTHLFARITSLIAATFFTAPAFAFYTLQDTGDLLKPKENQLGAEVQFITHGDTTGVNAIGRLDKGLKDDMNLRFEFGAGTTDLVAGAYLKWVPYPDYDRQPAVGFTVGAHYAHYNSNSEVALRLIPFASKSFETDIGTVTPFAGLPFAIASYNGESTVPVQLALGSRYRNPEVKQCDFTVELDFDIHSAPNAITFGAIFPAF